ncbi:MAG: class I SAM-dependent methyltransferase [Betaproteobacteria bacterium]|nr:class I SAM-dependent methyltransferase [Betaproteobacteria bacterium]
MLIHSWGENKPREWFATRFGRYVLAQERRYCGLMAGDCFGVFALHLGNPPRPPRRAPQRHCIAVGLDKECAVAADWTALPFAAESVDFVLLAHALESARAPHAVLREAVRVLRPHGRLLIAGFNPWSLLGMRLAELPWRKRWLSLLRVKDWLKLLDMSVTEGRFAVFMPPHESRRARRRFRWMEKAGRRWWPLGGGVYFISAVKTTPGAQLVGRLRYPPPSGRRRLAGARRECGL